MYQIVPQGSVLRRFYTISSCGFCFGSCADNLLLPVFIIIFPLDNFLHNSTSYSISYSSDSSSCDWIYHISE